MTEAPKWNSGNVWAEVRSGLSMHRERLVQAFDSSNYALESSRIDDVARRITERIDPLFAEHARLVAEKDAEIERLRENAEAMKDAKLADAKSYAVGSELRLMKALQADGMISVLNLIDALIAKETHDAD